LHGSKETLPAWNAMEKLDFGIADTYLGGVRSASSRTTHLPADFDLALSYEYPGAFAHPSDDGIHKMCIAQIREESRDAILRNGNQ
jgi:hypothetical protein